MRDKDELLDDIVEYHNKSGELDYETLIITILSMLLVLVLLMPKIYISNHIYFESLKLAKLNKNYTMLIEENKNLKEELVKKKFFLKIRDKLNEQN